MLKNKIVLLAFAATFLGPAVNLLAEETVVEKAETGINKGVDSAKHSMRHAKDKTCEMVNGKMHCMGQKMKHKGQDMSDKMKTKATEVKNEVK